MIKPRILKWRDYPELTAWALNSIWCIQIRRRQGRFDTNREDDVKLHQRDRFKDAGLRDRSDVITSQGISAATRNCKSQGTGSPSEPPEVVWPCGHLDIWPNETDHGLLASRSVRAYLSVVWSHQVHGNLPQQPQEMNTLLWPSSRHLRQSTYLLLSHSLTIKSTRPTLSPAVSTHSSRQAPQVRPSGIQNSHPVITTKRSDYD